MGIEKHQKDYKEDVWKEYSISELGNFVHNLDKRASHRVNIDKTKKDLYDAKNYLWMIEQKLRLRAKELHIEWSELDG